MVTGCPDRHRCLLHTLVEKLQLLKTFRNKLADAGAHSFHFEQVWRRSVQTAEIWQSHQPDEERIQTDRQTAFQLYIVDFSVHCCSHSSASWCKC